MQLLRGWVSKGLWKFTQAGPWERRVILSILIVDTKRRELKPGSLHRSQFGLEVEGRIRVQISCLLGGPISDKTVTPLFLPPSLLSPSLPSYLPSLLLPFFSSCFLPFFLSSQHQRRSSEQDRYAYMEFSVHTIHTYL